MPSTLKHYVEFFSPGTFVSEVSRKPIESWDTKVAAESANAILERHNAKPYGFKFVTMREHDPIDDGEGGKLDVRAKEVDRSPMHWLGGKVILFDDVPDDREHHIMRANMRGNENPVCIENNNSWRFTGVFEPNHVIIGTDGLVNCLGSSEELVAYRERKIAEWKREREERIAAS